MKRLSLSKEEIERLLDCENYREFALRIIAARAPSAHPLTYAQIGRAFGISSRSYPRDILLGKKRLTPALFPKLAQVLGLPAELKRYFELLVERDEPGCRLSGHSPTKIDKMLGNVKSRIRQKDVLHVGFENAFELSDIPKVYAALGTTDGGASLPEIISRVGLDSARVKATLSPMLEMGLAQKRATRYYPLNGHVNTAGLRQSEIFKKHFQTVTEESLAVSRVGMSSEEKLFFSSALSVRADRMPELKNELRSLLLKFVDNSEEARGDRVVSLVCALH